MHTNCLLGLGSNLGNREETLCDAIEAIGALPGVTLSRQSRLYRSDPVGGPAGQGEFLNTAVIVETELKPLALLDEFHRIEQGFGRVESERWAARTLDIDILLVGDRVIETGRLTVPHPRMSFRRFVLEPSSEIAGEMVHPTIGWTIRQLRDHLESASDRIAIVSSEEPLRRGLAEFLVERCGGKLVETPAQTMGQTFLSVEKNRSAADRNICPTVRSEPLPPPDDLAADFPKLTIVIAVNQPDPKAQRAAIERQKLSGPTLVLRTSDRKTMESEILAAVEAVWPDLCPR
jgi:2-amino-4-hydroxy-6-hydroxymethyldihydropteridine diphosphokinase